MNNIESLIDSVARLAKDKSKSIVFAKHEGIIVPKHEHPFFMRYMADEQFPYVGYTDVVAGPYNAKHNAQRWCTELCETFRINQVETAVMYFRPESRERLDVRILIKTPEYLRRR